MESPRQDPGYTTPGEGYLVAMTPMNGTHHELELVLFNQAGQSVAVADVFDSFLFALSKCSGP